MTHITSYIKPSINADRYAQYETIIDDIDYRGPRQPEIREKNHSLLNEPVEADAQLRDLHRHCARAHNERIRGKHERILLSVHGKGMEDEDIKIGKAREQTEGEQERTGGWEEEEASSRGTTPGASGMAITQMDGAYDYDINMEGVLEGAPTANGVEIPEEQTTGNPERGAALIREPEQEITIARDVEMEDAEFAEPERDKISPVYGYQPFRCAATGEADMNSPETLERESTPLEPTTEQVIQAFSPESQQRDQALAEDGVVEMKSPDMPTSARSTAAVDGESLMFAPEVLMGNSAIHESGPEFDMEHLRESIDTGIVMAMPESAQKLQDEPVLSVELDAAHALQNTLFTTPAPFSSLRKSAISYLAWLQQRQKRFPTAHPHYPECIAIGKRLSRSPHYVYEDVLYHWGLETDSVYGAWHRQHRLQVLGEDPCPDEETVGLWAAWK